MVFHHIYEASDLSAEHVYRGEKDKFGNNVTYWESRIDATTKEFGATELGTAGEGSLQGVTQHAAIPGAPDYGYFSNRTESLRNIAYATTGQGERVTHD